MGYKKLPRNKSKKKSLKKFLECKNFLKQNVIFTKNIEAPPPTFDTPPTTFTPRALCTMNK